MFVNIYSTNFRYFSEICVNCMEKKNTRSRICTASQDKRGKHTPVRKLTDDEDGVKKVVQKSICRLY